MDVSQQDNSSLESQKQEFLKLGVPEKNILVEVGSAANEIKNRPIFQTLINQKLQEGDVLMVTKIDRCSRNTLEFLKLQDILFKRKIEFLQTLNFAPRFEFYLFVDLRKKGAG